MMKTNKNDIDSDDDIEGNDKFKEKERKDSSRIFQLWCITFMDKTYLLVNC